MTLEELRIIENFLDAHDSIAEAKEDVSCQILLNELHAMRPNEPREFYVDEAERFLGQERKKR